MPPKRREFLHPTFVRPIPNGGPDPGGNYPVTKVGTAGNITVYSGTDLGTRGQTLATALLRRVTGPYNDMEAFFGFQGGPVEVVVASLSGKNDGSGGAWHFGCNFVVGGGGGTLYVDATFALTNATDVGMVLYVAELS